MSTRTVHDPFTGKDVQVSNRLTDRLRGKYACGPIMENGEPEFGWRQHEVPPIQIEAAAHIEVLEAALREAGEMWVRKDNRIEQLEAVLRKVSGGCRVKADLYRQAHPEIPASFRWIADEIERALTPERTANETHEDTFKYLGRD